MPTFENELPHDFFFFFLTGWLGWAMVLGSFQCQGVLLLLHILGQGPAMRDGWAIFFCKFHLSSLSNVLSFWRQLNMTEILWFRLLNPNSSCQLLPRLGRPRVVLVNRLEGLSLPRKSATIN